MTRLSKKDPAVGRGDYAWRAMAVDVGSMYVWSSISRFRISSCNIVRNTVVLCILGRWRCNMFLLRCMWKWPQSYCFLYIIMLLLTRSCRLPRALLVTYRQLICLLVQIIKTIKLTPSQQVFNNEYFEMRGGRHSLGLTHVPAKTTSLFSSIF